jgi:hypothetical protein
MTLTAKNLSTPDHNYSLAHGEMHVVTVAGATIARAEFRPGWRWSTDVKPSMGTRSCQTAHTGLVLSGRLGIRMDDGTEAEFGPGDAHVISPGHDAWVIGTEPCVLIDVDIPQTETDTCMQEARCPCGVEFRAPAGAVDHLIDAIQQHASGSHGHQASREHIRSELTPG